MDPSLFATTVVVSEYVLTEAYTVAMLLTMALAWASMPEAVPANAGVEAIARRTAQKQGLKYNLN